MLRYTLSYGECMGFPINFQKALEKGVKLIEWEKPAKLVDGKILQNLSHVENLGNCYSYFPHSRGALFPLDSHHMVYFIICEMYGFPNPFPISSIFQTNCKNR